MNDADTTDSASGRLSTLDLFAGAGGLSEGFREASPRYAVARAVELNTAAAATFEANFGAVVYAGSISDWLLEEKVPEADIVVGGPPCQGFSTLGKQQADDLRNTLWRAYTKTVERAQPNYFVMENVPQFLTSAQFPELRAQTFGNGPLRDYQVEARVLNAADFGAAQLRKRVIVIGWRRDLRPPGFPEPTHPDASTWRSVTDAWTGLTPQVAESRPPERKTFFHGNQLAGPYRLDELHLTRNYRDISLRRFAAIPAGGGRRDLPDELQMACWRGHQTGSFDVMGRLDPLKPAVTLRTEFTKPEKGRYLHPRENRAITIAEGGRLQGFPDDYRFVGSLTQITKQIGNAVPVPLARAIAEHLLEALDARA